MQYLAEHLQFITECRDKFVLIHTKELTMVSFLHQKFWQQCCNWLCDVTV